MRCSSTKTPLRFRLLTAAVFWLATTAAALAQQFPTVPDRSVIGRIGVGGQSGPSQAIPFTNFLPNLVGSQSANTIFAGPASGAANVPSFRLLVGADLPNPSASTLGGVQSLTCSASNWFNTLSTAGVLGCSQQNFNNLAGTIAGAQIPSSTITSAMIVDGTIVDADISASAAIAGSKITTVSNSVAGVVPALPNDSTKFFNGVGAYVAPPSAGTMILLNTLTASASATLSDTTSLTSTYSVYEIVFENLIPATNTQNLNLQVHSAAAFPATAYVTSTIDSNGGGAPSGSTSTTAIVIVRSQGNGSPGVSGSIRVHTPSGTTAPKMWVGQFVGNTITPAALLSNTTGYWNGNTAVDGFQVLFASGNITSGVIKIYGIQ